MSERITPEQDRYRMVTAAHPLGRALRDTLAHFGIPPLSWVDGSVVLTSAQHAWWDARAVGYWMIDPDPQATHPDAPMQRHMVDQSALYTRRGFYATATPKAFVLADPAEAAMEAAA